MIDSFVYAKSNFKKFMRRSLTMPHIFLLHFRINTMNKKFYTWKQLPIHLILSKNWIWRNLQETRGFQKRTNEFLNKFFKLILNAFAGIKVLPVFGSFDIREIDWSEYYSRCTRDLCLHNSTRIKTTRTRPDWKKQPNWVKSIVSTPIVLCILVDEVRKIGHCTQIIRWHA